jgi:hypothetical protein
LTAFALTAASQAFAGRNPAAGNRAPKLRRSAERVVEPASLPGYNERMKPRVYLETTIPSYLTAWPSRDLVRAAHQQITREWWDRRRGQFELFISQVVVRECQAGDPDAAAQRLDVLRDLPLLEQTEEATALAQALLEQVPLPDRAAVDALHIAVATVHGMDYLLTWNCTHIANAALRDPIESVCRASGYEPPAICTPEELLSEEGLERG